MNAKQKLLIAGVAMVPLLGIGGIAYSSASGAASGTRTTSVVAQAQGPETSDATTPEATTPEATTPEATTPEADGPGGHQDPTGSNVDHQFEGQE